MTLILTFSRRQNFTTENRESDHGNLAGSARSTLRSISVASLHETYDRGVLRLALSSVRTFPRHADTTCLCTHIHTKKVQHGANPSTTF